MDKGCPSENIFKNFPAPFSREISPATDEFSAAAEEPSGFKKETSQIKEAVQEIKAGTPPITTEASELNGGTSRLIS